MKKIIGYRKVLGVDDKAGLKELKTAYRNLMKDCHPDRFTEGTEQEEAGEKSKKIIEAYHYLVSVSSETHAAAFEEYSTAISSSTITDINYKGGNLSITFAEGNSYEYLDVPRAIYIKLVNADTPGRFARRHICGTYTYRELTRAAAIV